MNPPQKNTCVQTAVPRNNHEGELVLIKPSVMKRVEVK